MAQLFRTTTYEVPAGSFTGTSYTLTLNQALEADYYVEIQGVGNANVRQLLCDSVCRVSADPFGTGDLSLSGAANQITLARGAVNVTPDGDWVGTIVVHECLDSTSADGFKLADVTVTSIPVQTGGSVVDTTQAISGVTDATQVVPFCGRGGGGVATASTLNTHSTHALGILATVDSSTQVTFSRQTNYGYDADAVDITTYLVEFGSNWNIQTADFSSSTAGLGVDATTEYATAALTSAPAANTKLFATGHDDASSQGTGGTNQGITVMMGDGVTVGDDSVALGKAVGTIVVTAKVYAMTHSSLDVDWVFQSVTSPSGISTVALTIPSAANAETYGSNYTEGRSVAIRSSIPNTEATHNLREQVFGRITADTTLTWRAGPEPSYNSDGLAFWVSVEDYAAFTYSAGAADYAGSGDLAGTSSLAGAANLTLRAAGSIAGTSAFIGSATLEAGGSNSSLTGALAGSLAMQATGSLTVATTGNLAGSSSFAGDASVNRPATGALTGALSLAGSATVKTPQNYAASGAIVGTMTLQAIAQLPYSLTPSYTTLSAATPNYNPTDNPASPSFTNVQAVTPNYERL